MRYFAVETQTGNGDAFAGRHLQHGFAGLGLNGFAVQNKFKGIGSVAHYFTSLLNRWGSG